GHHRRAHAARLLPAQRAGLAGCAVPPQAPTTSGRRTPSLGLHRPQRPPLRRPGDRPRQPLPRCRDHNPDGMLVHGRVAGRAGLATVTASLVIFASAALSANVLHHELEVERAAEIVPLPDEGILLHNLGTIAGARFDRSFHADPQAVEFELCSGALWEP